jgi:uncharacterized protein YeaO (DUF488 family)/DNA-binding MarR family transcriptional regulator
MRVTLPDSTYAKLLALRTGLRHFERWSEQQAQAAGLTPAQHQLLLAIRGHHDERGATIGEVADYLLLRHHSVVGLIDRAETAGLVSRTRDEDDHRVVRLHLTKSGAKRLEALSELHLEELERLAPQLPGAWEGLAPTQRTHGFAGSPISKVEPVQVRLAHVYDKTAKSPSGRVLVDRLWPRGLPRAELSFEMWAKDLAPSTTLRKWYGHSPARFEEFGRRYRAELAVPPAQNALEKLRLRAGEGDVVLLTATKDITHSHAAVLQGLLAAY